MVLSFHIQNGRRTGRLARAPQRDRLESTQIIAAAAIVIGNNAAVSMTPKTRSVAARAIPADLV